MLEEKNIFVGGVEYTCDRKTLIQFPENLEIQEYTVPEGTEEIGITAFFNCPKLHSVTLPQSLQVIDSSAFQQCSNLQTLTLPTNVKTIAPNAFLDCPAKLISESPYFTVDRFGALIWKNKTLLCIPTDLEYYEVHENVIFIGSDVCMFGKLKKSFCATMYFQSATMLLSDVKTCSLLICLQHFLKTEATLFI